MNKLVLYWIILLTISWVSCKSDLPKKKRLSRKETEQLLIDSQRAYVKQEDRMMDDYAKDHQWQNTIISDTGIRYTIYRKGVGKSFEEIKKENKNGPIQVAIRYQSSLLDGTPCYSATIERPMIFTVGESEAISGLHELVTYLREGDLVYAIIPPRLAYGLAGDLDQVPPNSPVVYDLEILQWNY